MVAAIIKTLNISDIQTMTHYLINTCLFIKSKKVYHKDILFLILKKFNTKLF